MDIHDVFQPFYCFGRIFGFFCFTFEPWPNGGPRDANDDSGNSTVTDVAATTSTTTISALASSQTVRRQARTSVPNVLCLMLNVAVLVWSMLTVRSDSDLTVLLPLLDRAMDAVLRLSHVMTLITYAMLFVWRMEAARLLSDLCDMDLELEALGISVNHSLHRRYVIAGCALVSAIKLLMVTVSSQVLFTSVNTPLYDLVTSCFVFVYANTTYAIVMSAYTLGMCTLLHRLWLMNGHLRAISISETGNESALRVQRMARIYDRITEMCSLNNKLFAVPVMSGVLTAFGYNVISVYAGFKLECDATEHVWHMAVNVCWNVFFLAFVVGLVMVGSGLARAGRKTGHDVHWLLNRMSVDGENVALVRQLERFSLQVLQKHPLPSCGLFRVDWTLASSIIATSGTYLVILVQFDSTLAPNVTNKTDIISC